MNNDLASVIILTLNRLDYLKHNLDSVIRKPGYHPLEIIVVDNGSTDGTPEYLLELLAQNQIQTVILNSTNNFAGAAMNQGLKLAKGRFLVRSDDDMVYNQNWLKILIDALRKIPKALLQVAVFGELVPDGKETHFSDAVTINGIVLRKMKIGGCNMALTRESFEKLGYFDEVPLAEDAGYNRKAMQRQFIIGQVAGVTGTHIDYPTCTLSQRYTKYSQFRLQNLQRLKTQGIPFPFPEDYQLFEKWQSNETGPENPSPD